MQQLPNATEDSVESPGEEEGKKSKVSKTQKVPKRQFKKMKVNDFHISIIEFLNLPKGFAIELCNYYVSLQIRSMQKKKN